MIVNLTTYFDKNYLSRFLNLKSSFEQFNIDHKFYVLCLDEYVYEFLKEKNFSNIETISLSQIEEKYEDLKNVKINRFSFKFFANS